MTYKEYIDLGFIRVDTNDSQEFNETGYRGFYLIKDISDNLSIQVYYGELDKPKLYIEKQHQEDNYHIVQLTPVMVKDMVYKDEPKSKRYVDPHTKMYTAC